MNDLKDTEIAYIAGLFDGEGSVGYYKYGSKSRYLTVVQIANSDIRVMNWLRQKLSFGRVNGHQRNSSNIGFMWYINKKSDITQFLKAVQPYLVIKRDQVDLLLNFLDAEQDVRGNRKHLTEAERDERNVLVDALKTLKTASYQSVQ